MPLIGSILKRTITLGQTLDSRKRKNGTLSQLKVLRKLLLQARHTQFGSKFHFDKMLKSKNAAQLFKKHVPVYDYSKIYHEWWYRAHHGEEDVCWPGEIRYFALSSGTSDASSKFIPVTTDMIKSVNKTSKRQILSLAHYPLPDEFFTKEVLMLGGSTNLVQVQDHFEGDLSGILAATLPKWFHRFYKPGYQISQEKDWNTKLDKIAKEAHKWDIAVICGVPAWVQMLLERIIAYHKVDNIHQVWPNFQFFAHGGVSFKPYKKGFRKLLGKDINYLETYLASEGFLAYQNRPDTEGMRLVYDRNIFFEFIPFDESNFASDGTIRENPTTYFIDEVEEGKEYAILISTNAGAWRYLIGDTIKFTSLKDYEIIITGRTKHFLSLCGEHLSVDNMNLAVQMVSEEFGLDVKEFTVSGIEYEGLFAHKWYLGTEKSIDKTLIKERLDEKLKELNDDYRTERTAALKEVFVEMVPNQVFLGWMKSLGKEGGQSKFPRVLRKDLFEDWEKFVSNNISI